jgi:outer membrane protein OmpA-like peptidoglycan-associated protein
LFALHAIGYCPLLNVRHPERDGPGAGEPAVMMKAARTTCQFGGALAVALVFFACAGAAEPVKPGLKPVLPGATGAAATVNQGHTVALAEAPSQELLASVTFAPQSVELNQIGMRALSALSARLTKEPETRIAILAYAGSDGVDMSARRISLGRALSVRSYLIEHGVQSQRMIVRALGKPQQTRAADHVDILLPPR